MGAATEQSSAADVRVVSYSLSFSRKKIPKTCSSEAEKCCYKGERKEHSIPAGTLVIEGQPVVCESVTGGNRIYRRQVGREDNDHENDQTFASHLIVTKVREFVTRTHERDPDAQQVGGAAAKRSGRTSSNANEQEHVMGLREVQRIGNIFTMMQDKSWVPAMEAAMNAEPAEDEEEDSDGEEGEEREDEAE